MKLCIFAGTFNPIHNAHIKIAQYAVDKFDYDKILFIPAYKPPHKDTLLSEHRYNMVSLAIKNNPNFDISNIEYQRESKSYTYLTILELYKQYNIDNKINMLIGTDAFDKIESWYESEKLKELVDFIVFVRENNKINYDNLKAKGYNFRFAQMEYIDISSTELRKKIRNNEPIENYVPKEVGDYIEKYRLYR